MHIYTIGVKLRHIPQYTLVDILQPDIVLNNIKRLVSSDLAQNISLSADL